MQPVTTNSETWAEVTDFLKGVSLPFQYSKTFNHNDKNVSLTIDIDAGGGFESGYEFTSLTAPVPVQFTSISSPLATGSSLVFAVHDSKVMDRIGKVFGAEDVEIGYAEFDKLLVVKTNDKEALREIFSDREVRETFRELKEFSLEITEHEDGNPSHTLEFIIDRAITDVEELQKIFSAFTTVLDNILEMNRS